MFVGKFLPLAAANEFIALAPNGVSHMKLQKLVYMAHGAWLKDHPEPFLSENPQVWQYGPVFQSLYHELKHFRSEPITEPQTHLNFPVRIDDKSIKSIIEKVWDKYKDASGPRLSDITHLPGSPWFKIAQEHGFSVPMGTEISPALIGQYFRETANMAI
jgi:uncharacterized phage-associated protein